MGYIAKGTITLGAVNDAYTVSLSKPSCVIHADYDGSNPKLDDAQTTIKVFRGDKIIEFDCALNDNTDETGVADITDQGDRLSYLLTIASVPTDTLEGAFSLHISTDDGYETDIEFGYSIVRESSMLDWIQDWEGGKTKIGSTYVMTPKLFIGKKSDYSKYAEGGSEEKTSIMSVPGLTGVYIGPDSDSTGIYGYKDSTEIFHLNSTGGMIGGWDIDGNGIYSKDGLMRILSDGSIAALNNTGSTVWQIKSDGTASFAAGNVQFNADGSAEFKGTVTSTEGSIGGWSISQNQISQGHIGLDLIDNAIGVTRDNIVTSATGEGPILKNVKQSGGVALYYTSNTAWGLVGYSAGTLTKAGSQVFALGQSNKIAGWQFDDVALWTGTKNNTSGAYTTGGISIGTAGLRGQHWYIDNDGDFSFMDGLIQFATADNGGNIVGWMLNDKRFSTDNVAIVSDGNNAGIYMTVADGVSLNSVASTSLADTVGNNGGVYMKVNSTGTLFTAYSNSKEKTFELNSYGVCSIGGWNFDGDALYVGTKNSSSSEFTADSGSITIAPTGIRSHLWRLESDGSGSLANDSIVWDADGAMTINGYLSANNITSGTISTADIKSTGDTWHLYQNGSGKLGNGKISWDKDGALTIGNWYIVDGTITSNKSGTEENYVTLNATEEKIVLEASSATMDYGLQGAYGAVMTLDAAKGTIEVSAKNAPSYSTATSYISSNGIFCNIAETNAVAGSTGLNHRGAIVGIGFANVAKDELATDADEVVVAGVYGRASNQGTAPAYGGFFYQLRACGFSTSVYYFANGKDGAQLALNKTTVIGCITSGKTCTLYLPANAHDGQEIEVIQMSKGTTRIDTNDGTYLFDDSSVNDYYDCPEGYTLICKRVTGAIEGNVYDFWTVRKYKF